MEGKDPEKPKIKLEAQYSFNPIAATTDDWKKYLLNPKNFEKDFTQGDYPFKAPAVSILEKIREAGTPRSVVETAVETVLEWWDDIVGQDPFLMDIPPITFVATLADEASVDIVQRLWTDAPKDSKFLQKGLRQVAEGMGPNIPIDQEGLEKLYTEQFDVYGFTALEIMLKRGETDRASALFEEYVDRYPKGNDPGMLDRFVMIGLHPSSAKKWLDQSANKGPGYEPWYREALERWGYTQTQ